MNLACYSKEELQQLAKEAAEKHISIQDLIHNKSVQRSEAQ